MSCDNINGGDKTTLAGQVFPGIASFLYDSSQKRSFETNGHWFIFLNDFTFLTEHWIISSTL